jgi:FkbM family methyltransferase
MERRIDACTLFCAKHCGMAQPFFAKLSAWMKNTPAPAGATIIPEPIGYHSYSIEAEDLLAASIFARVIYKNDPGFYLDIGAHHPIRHSNTYLFYTRGWRGICVEPNPEFLPLHKQERPRDKIINAGLASQSGMLRYHRFDESLENGFFGDEHIANRVADNRTYLGHSDVPCLGVRDFLAAEVNGKVDFLNIDVETKEPEILATWDWSLCRPSVICAEIHARDIDAMLKSDVTTILLNAGYTPMSRGYMSAMFVSRDYL